MNRCLCLLLFFISFAAHGQKQANIWYFGQQCGLDFSNGAPVSITGGQTGTDAGFSYTQEGTASICDSAGRLLFYTGGHTIWNRNHGVMPNGSNLYGGTSSTQSSLIIPKPGSDSLFYVFTSDQFQTLPWSHGYRYSIVDMCLDSTRGDVVAGQKNILLADSCTEKLCACEDSTGTGYWIVGHKMYSSQFIAWHLTSSGIIGTVISNVGYYHGTSNPPGSAQGQMKLNSSGNRLALVLGNNDPAILELFDFNNATGQISNACSMHVDSAYWCRAYGVEFSPDDSKLYIGLAGGSVGKHIYQYDLNAGLGNCDSIKASCFTLWTDPSGVNGSSVLDGFQLGPDGKIYLVFGNYYMLGCISFPNLSGTAASFFWGPAVGTLNTGIMNNYTLPSFIAGYKYHNRTIPCKLMPSVTINASNNSVCNGTSVKFTASATNGGTSPIYHWIVNNSNVGTNSASYTYVPANNDTVECVLTSNSASAPMPNCVSNKIVTVVNAPVVPGINANTIPPVVGCEGVPILFVTNIVAGGVNPMYQWYKNGIALPGATNSIYVESTPKSGDTIQVSLMSSATCISTPITWSNHVALALKPATTPTIAISPAGTVSAGLPITFMATAAGYGTAPQYQWQKNGQDIPFANGATYTTPGLNAGDSISVVLISNDPCAMPVMVSSNSVAALSESTGISAAANNWFISLYPNPNRGSFAISIIDQGVVYSRSYGIDVTNSLGQSLYHTEVEGQTRPISHSIMLPDNIPDGIYFVKAYAKNGAAVIRFVLRRQ